MSVTVIEQTIQILEVTDRLYSVLQVDPTLLKPLLFLATLPFVFYVLVIRPLCRLVNSRLQRTTVYKSSGTADSGFQTSPLYTRNYYGVVYNQGGMSPSDCGRYNCSAKEAFKRQCVYRDKAQLAHENRDGVIVNPEQHVGPDPDLENGTYTEYRFLNDT